MGSLSSFVFVFFFIIVLAFPMKPVSGEALYTESRWVVKEGGGRVKLACVNWVSHLDTVVAEGLHKQPLDVISKKIKSMGFNCVRLTWPIYLVTNESLGSLTVRRSFQNLGLLGAIAGVQAKNPDIIDLPLIKAFQAVVKNLGDNDVMVILDNHRTDPGWCCGSTDGNGFFGDEHFDPDLWVQGLTKMATLFRGVPHVVAMSLRNELRGPRQNVPDWFKYMQRGAEAVHSANPDVLVILSGLSFDTDLSFLGGRKPTLTFSKKLVYEAHWYGFTNGKVWVSTNLNQACAQITGNVMSHSGFLLGQGFPLFFSEFGMDLTGSNLNDIRYFHCFMALAAELDFDWALWSLVGSYYYREGVPGTTENYGVLDAEWAQVKNPGFLRRISSLQVPFRGPGVSGGSPHQVIFHPLTGLCVSRKSGGLEPLALGACSDSEGWNYTNQRIVPVKGRNLCLQAGQLGKAVKVAGTCSDSDSRWEMISDSKMHLSSKVSDNSTVCLDVDSNNIVVTSACKCLSTDSTCDPTSQWFKFVDSTRG
ncbi:glycosyl hydrolase 5 family protein-like [Neltuma alba]|uniref:glycosyl hydrolase 5 family protein-like n=1 Tax=Neltuma alba TaxID=207710 RepID=UPI0010A3B056|nr:glycosyl hydrolase 5 family protein-like [Prosopis alba]XP_028786990.1 glycosyl hydrolase 5 family protein-like [Prosopis alba]